MQGRYEESLIDLQTLLKIDPENKAAKKEIVCVEKEVNRFHVFMFDSRYD